MIFLELMAQKQNMPSRPHELRPIFISNADKQDTHSVAQSYIYRPMYSELKTKLSFGDMGLQKGTPDHGTSEPLRSARNSVKQSPHAKHDV
jgi:hypothetical protein